MGLIIDTRWSYTTLSVDDSLFDLSFSEHVARIRVNNHNITVGTDKSRSRSRSRSRSSPDKSRSRSRSRSVGGNRKLTTHAASKVGVGIIIARIWIKAGSRSS